MTVVRITFSSYCGFVFQAVGISVEFVSHLTRSFALSIRPTKVERAKEATINMGSAVSTIASSVMHKFTCPVVVLFHECVCFFARCLLELQ